MSVRSTYRFARVPEWIVFHPDLNSTDKVVFAALDRFDGRECIPGIATVAERIHCSRRTVENSLNNLEAVGALRRENRAIEGRKTSNRYVLAGDEPLRSDAQNPADTDAQDSAPPYAQGVAHNPEQEDPEQEDPTRALSPDAEYLCVFMADAIENYGSKRPTPGVSWVKDMDRLLRLDGRDPEEVERVIRWLYTSNNEVAVFWAPNIHSPKKLRQKWDVLRAQVNRQRQKGIALDPMSRYLDMVAQEGQ